MQMAVDIVCIGSGVCLIMSVKPYVYTVESMWVEQIDLYLIIMHAYWFKDSVWV
jgi:hypothetical protein